jgi:hypothetical protein
MHAPLIGVAFSAAGVFALPLGMPMPGGSNAMLRGNAGGASSGAPPHEYPDGANLDSNNSTHNFCSLDRLVISLPPPNTRT